ncbi:CDP-alcohol phosphatidyltransferase family protein [Gaoshiqia sediminis]|uniref:CDP-alcohol phosphatidyltransferase family protein n=1 Tax=Gaoshiqia sediminis TaxID=2986998 RepID=A0AA41YDF2_9BACT|nr:CDP-alcohol phosphatidyltransferase family protein [Gaoshiqia sediminis]MCW0483327.1 CDP-alcohol phosphatidyltransferase family protein [Gaoshiqia sediminis]
MNKLSSYFFWVPNFITALNLAAGSMAVFLGIEGQLVWAACCIVAAAVFDFLDGMAARLLHAYSEIGKQLDSLADLVSFGLAPAAILMSLLQLAMFENIRPLALIEASPLQWVFLLSALLVPIAGAFRLAKFNLDTRQSDNFLGLPIPANALFYASLALVVELGNHPAISKIILSRFNLLTIMVLLSALMISELPMFSMKVKHLKWQGNQVRFLFAGLCIVLLILLKLYAFPLIIISYILIAVVSKLAA